MTTSSALTAVAFLCYYSVALCLMFSKKTTTIAFSFITVQRHRPLATTTSWCSSHETTASSGETSWETDYNGDNAYDEKPQEQHCGEVGVQVQQQRRRRSHQPTSSRRKVISSTMAGFAAIITSGVVTPQLKHAFAFNGVKLPVSGARTMTSQVSMDDQAVVRQYAGVFLEKMLGELIAGEGGDKGVEHVFRNLALYLSPPVTAIDGGGVPLVRLRNGLVPGVGDRFEALALNGARLADAILAEIPYAGTSAHDPGRVLIRSAQFDQPSTQVDAIFASIWAAAPLEAFKVGR
eukprot:CAMPEP_0194296124 /NCGR_PEP_ID=MMETSP0169-20130528/55233_1 /TAXON_ID=218684 /ORGANISM="Corethron pennatum, Strain L29A3" /LENGTH=291 /DNA_ID=CAMNT_0039045497 /DNA_START=36 /DNA_END=911 /DNA_ORIENTATION=-